MIPGSRNLRHIKANLDVLDFALTEDEIAEMDGEKYYHTNNPEKLKQYETLVPAVNGQK